MSISSNTAPVFTVSEVHHSQTYVEEGQQTDPVRVGRKTTKLGETSQRQLPPQHSQINSGQTSRRNISIPVDAAHRGSELDRVSNHSANTYTGAYDVESHSHAVLWQPESYDNENVVQAVSHSREENMNLDYSKYSSSGELVLETGTEDTSSPLLDVSTSQSLSHRDAYAVYHSNSVLSPAGNRHGNMDTAKVSVKLEPDEGVPELSFCQEYGNSRMRHTRHVGLGFYSNSDSSEPVCQLSNFQEYSIPSLSHMDDGNIGGHLEGIPSPHSPMFEDDVCGLSDAKTQSSLQCSLCGMAFSNAGNLQRHRRVHTGERPYKCPVCHKCFRQSGTLKIHLRIHTGDKPYKCSKCGRAFSNNSHLWKHERMSSCGC